MPGPASSARRTRLARVVRLGCATALAAYCAVLAAGTVLTFTQVPRTHADARRTTALVDTLLQHDVKHFYADYWTCGRVAFTEGLAKLSEAAPPRIGNNS